MIYRIGRALQLLGMLLLPLAIAGTETGRFGTKDELVLLGLGVLIFFIGWRMQEAAKQ